MRRVVIVSLSLCFLGSFGCAKPTDPNLCAEVTAHKTKLLNGEGEVDEALAMLNQELINAFEADCKAGKFSTKVLECVKAAKDAAAAEACETGA